MQVMWETFCQWASWTPETESDWEGNEHPVWIVPSLFWVMLYKDDGLYLPGDAETELERVL